MGDRKLETVAKEVFLSIIHADDSNRLGLYDTDGKALLANGKDE